MYIENKVKDKLKNIVFLELKKDTELKGGNGSFVINKELPLPINLNNLMNGIKTNEFEDSVDLKKINNGIIYLLGIEEDFKYREEYIEILNATILKKDEYIFALALKEIERKNNLDAYIYLRARNSICDQTLESKFMEMNILEYIYNEYIENLKDEEKSMILERIIKEYEKIISKNPEYAPVYYRLGYIYRAVSKYLKSKLYFEKFLRFSDNEIMKEEVREALKEIDDYANVEIAITYISYGKFEDAYASLQEITGLYPKKDEVMYYKGLCEYYLGSPEKSIESINAAIDLDKTHEEYYNQLAISFIALGEEEKAIEVYKKAVSNIEESYTLYYNLGILMLNMGKEGYMQYLKKAYHLNPSEELQKLIEA